MPRASRFPIVTLVATTLVAMTSLWTWSQGFPDETLASTPTRQWIYLSSWNVWSGGYWALLTASLANFGAPLLYAAAHLALGLTGLWVFGRRVELALGRETTMALLFFGALASSACALAFGTWPVLGSTGMACALLGAMHATWRRHFLFAEMLVDPRRRWFLLGWIGLTALNGQMDSMWMSNAAHAGGWALGYCVGKAFHARRPRRLLAGLGLAALAALAVMAVAWMPWNPDWRLWRAVERIKEGRVQEALADIESLTRRKPDWPQGLNAVAWTLATSPRDQVRDGRKAIDLARRACALTQWNIPEYIDTLAAAHAEAGQWNQALGTERLAMTVAQEQGETTASADYLKTNLRLIEGKRPIRD
jgi:membrane associated rhomboid family serine protease